MIKWWEFLAAAIVWLFSHNNGILVSAFFASRISPSRTFKFDFSELSKYSTRQFDNSATRTMRTLSLFAKRRGKLGWLIEEGLANISDSRAKKTSRGGKKGMNAPSQQVSPDLANYLLSRGNQPSTSPVRDETKGSSSQEMKSSASRRGRTTERMVIDEEKSKAVKVIVKDLQEAIAKGKGIVSAVESAVEKLPNVNKLKQFVKSPNPLDYRLAWIASDAAMCAIGSALHRKIALARLQEVYLTLHRNRLQMVEVVRILGPFPNVKNTLSGSAKFARSDQPNLMTITWQSLIDGTGKEKLEGAETIVVVLDILHGDDQLIIARLVDEDIPNGEDCFVFFRDEDMDKTLGSLRVL